MVGLRLRPPAGGLRSGNSVLILIFLKGGVPMGKVCMACGAVPENPDPEMEKEDCPGCGGEGTVQEEAEEKSGMAEEE